MRSTNLFILSLVIIVLLLLYLKWYVRNDVKTYIDQSPPPSPVTGITPLPSLEPSPISTDSATESAILE